VRVDEIADAETSVAEKVPVSVLVADSADVEVSVAESVPVSLAEMLLDAGVSRATLSIYVPPVDAAPSLH